MREIASISIIQFSIVYILLLVVLAVMKKAKINQTKLLFAASVRLTLQLTLAGFVLTYIFENPHPIFILMYLTSMILFAIHRVLSKNKCMNRGFKIAVSLSLACSGLGIVIFFVTAVVGQSIFNPQYVIPLSGMIIGNAMTGVNLATKTFCESLSERRLQMESLLNLGVTPQKILLPMVNQALETALLPTLNSMLGMGIVSLPGMMTGQILSGTLPTTAILYQISIMIAICAVVCLSVFGSLYFGYKTLYNSRNQFLYL